VSPNLRLRVALERGDPPAFTLLLGFEGTAEEVELARQPISGTPIKGDLWRVGDIVWLLTGSVADGEPLRRAVGLRRGSLRRGEAELHNRRGLALRAAHDLAGASGEFDRAIAVDPGYVEPLYNAASVAALSGRNEQAVVLLRRAAEVDRRRVQVLGRSDESLATLRQRADVRDILGMKRPPP
jgi:tetratricopeptide (TPR) repeat protein